MDNDNELQLLKNELLEAIRCFVKRQELVAQALREFGLDFTAMYILGAGGWTLGAEGAKQLIEVSPNNLGDRFSDGLKRMIENNTPRVNQKGTWQDNNGEMWKYHLHGGGCLLTNEATEEQINWDCPSIIHFDVYKFCFHLKWQIKSFPKKFPYLKIFLQKNDVFTIRHTLIPELVNEGKLINDLGNLYRVA